MHNGLLQLTHRIIEASWQQETFEGAPSTLDEIQVRTVGRQPVQPQPLRRPLLLTLPNHPGCVERGVAQDHHASLVRPLRLLGQSIQVALNLCAAARALDQGALQTLDLPFQGQRADEVDPPPRSPASPHPVLVEGTLPRPGVARGQTQTEAALVEVLQDDLPFECPLLRASNSSLAAFSSSGSGGLVGT